MPNYREQPSQLPEALPFRSKADVFRENGLCECCGMNKADQHIAGLVYFSEHELSDLGGAAFSDDCAERENDYRGAKEMGKLIRANRSTPAVPVASPEVESDEQWLKRAVMESTGLNTARITGRYVLTETLKIDFGERTLSFSLSEEVLCERSRGDLQRALSNAGLIIKNTPIARAAPGVTPGVAAARKLLDSAVPEPAAEPHPCAECSRAATTLDQYDQRWRCSYCAHRREHADQVALTSTDATAGAFEARQRLSALEERTARLNPVSKSQRELARPHPWECDDDV